MRKRQPFGPSSSTDGHPPQTPQKGSHAPPQLSAADADADTARAAEAQPEEVLIADARAHLTPAQIVEQRLLRLVGRALGRKRSPGLLRRSGLAR